MEQKLYRLIRQRELPLYVGLKRTQIGALIKAGEFPKPVSLSDTGRAVAWLETEIIDWQLRRLTKREAA